MICKNCGTNLDDDAVFCANCGTRVASETDEVQIAPDSQTTENVIEESLPVNAEVTEVSLEGPLPVNADEMDSQAIAPENGNVGVKYCHNCGAQNSLEDSFCVECGACINGSSIDNIAKTNPKKKSNLKKNLVILGAVAVAIVVIILAGVTVSRIGGQDTLLYEKEKSIFQLKKKEGVEIASNLYEDERTGVYETSISVSEDNKILFYPRNINDDHYYDLYWRKLNDVQAEGEKISSDVWKYSVLKNNNVILLSEDNKLMKYDFNEKVKIASDVSYFYISEDQKTILWISTEDGKVYKQDIGLKKDKEKIASSVEEIVYTSDNFDTIYYLTDDYDLYVMNNLKDKEKIESDVNIIKCLSSDGDIQFIYMKNDEEDQDSVSFSGLVEDDFPEDASMSEPRIEDYQREVVKESWWGPRTTIETDDAYYDALDKYNQKLNRDYYRESISDNFIETTSTIYVYDSKKKEKSKLFEGLVQDYSSGYNSLILTYLEENSENVVKLSQVIEWLNNDETEKLENQLMKATKTVLYTLNMETKIDIDLEEYSNINAAPLMVEDKNICYLVATRNSESKGRDLLTINYNQQEATPELVVEDFSNIRKIESGSVYYTCGTDENEYELYRDGEMISNELYNGYAFTISQDGASVAFKEDCNEDGHGTLYFYTNKKERIADDVSSFRINKKGDIAFLSDYNNSKQRGDLSVYKSGKTERIDEDVTSILYFN